jgi:hypothetical protein
MRRVDTEKGRRPTIVVVESPDGVAALIAGLSLPAMASPPSQAA